VQFVPEIMPRERADLGRHIRGIAHPAGVHARDQAFFKFCAHFGGDDEALGADAALAGIDEPGGGADLSGKL
jgi:hypothetical protein